MAKLIRDLTVSFNKQICGSQYFLLKLRSNEKMPIIKPGQFVEIKVDGADVLLRRPISIHFVDYEKDELWFLIMKVGRGTHKLAELNEGDSVNVVFPLGNGFPIEENVKNVLLIGGGVGIAPLLHLGMQLKENGANVTYLLGAKSKNNIVELDMYGRYGNVAISTEDGSMGESGFVTQNSVINAHYDRIYACGPLPMMKAVANMANGKNVDCYVSLDNKMACGLGACLCCVQDTKDGHKCVCTEGPVFNVNDLKW